MQQQPDDMDVDIPTLMAISNFTGVWVGDYSKYLTVKQTHCNENNQELVSNNLEFFGLIIYGILRIHGFRLNDVDDSNKDIIPWKCDPITKSFIKFELIHNECPSNWIFTVKVTSLFASNYIMTMNANLIHTITKLPNVQNWKIIFKLITNLNFKQMISECFKSPLTQKFAQLIGNQIYQIFLKEFWNLWQLHLQNINELTFDEDKMIKSFNENKKLLDSFESFTNSNRKLPFSLLTLRHIYLAFLCHLILQHLEWESFGINKNKNNNDNDIEMKDNNKNQKDEEEKAMMIDDDKLYETPQNKDDKEEDDGLYDYSMTNDVIATTITRCMRYHRPFDLKYRVKLPNGKNVKYTKIRYISMEHCALIIVNDEELIKCNIASPKVKITLNTYINNKGDIKNLSGRHSLIKLLCENIVRRAQDPLATTSSALGIMNSKIFSIDILSILFGFMDWKDLLHFGYCSQLAYNISNDPELWKLMYRKQFGDTDHIKGSVANWKNKFLTQYIQQKSGEDQATKDLIQRLMAQ